VGFVFQFYNLIASLTAEENVALAAELCRFDPGPKARWRPRDAREPLETLDLVGLADRADHFPAQLSGGEQQRVAIARAIVTRPRVVLCDEPTGALDASTGRKVLAVLAELCRRDGTSLVIITHNTARSPRWLIKSCGWPLEESPRPGAMSGRATQRSSTGEDAAAKTAPRALAAPRASRGRRPGRRARRRD
jgi:predicted ABC-type transport system involved in lysophospholipase L1 biosynthesis ATPase subunit